MSRQTVILRPPPIPPRVVLKENPRDIITLLTHHVYRILNDDEDPNNVLFRGYIEAVQNRASVTGWLNVDDTRAMDIIVDSIEESDPIGSEMIAAIRAKPRGWRELILKFRWATRRLDISRTQRAKLAISVHDEDIEDEPPAQANGHSKNGGNGSGNGGANDHRG
jgi:hypothetical protein